MGTGGGSFSSFSSPATGAFVVSADGKLRLGRAQVFLLVSHEAPDAERIVALQLGGAVYDGPDRWSGQS